MVENEAEGPGRSVCRRYAAAKALDIRYFAEPRPGIPVARNRCLEMAAESSDFIALIDDDEFPMPNWLDQLLSLQCLTRADVVTGSVVGANPISTPAWLARSRAHDSHPPVIADGAAINRLLRSLFRPFPGPKHVASGTVVNWCDSGNVLFRTDIIRATGARSTNPLAILVSALTRCSFEGLHLLAIGSFGRTKRSLHIKSLPSGCRRHGSFERHCNAGFAVYS